MNGEQNVKIDLRRVLRSAMFAAWIVVISGRNASCQGQFPDVPKGHWAYQAVLNLREKGILIGYPNGTFNGVVPAGIPKPKPVYDQSTPQSTWKSLLRAMANEDEDGIKGILGTDYDDSDSTIFIRFRSISNDVSVRKRAYRERAARWSQRYFHIDGRRSNDLETDADFDNPNWSELGFTTIKMKRYGLSWRIVYILPPG